MPRYVKIILWVCFGLFMAMVLVVALLSTFNLNYARPWINRQATELLDRPVQIQGDLSVKWLRPQDQDGWRGWVPWPEISAGQIIVANPEGSGLQGNMAEVKNLTAVVNPLALLGRTVQISRLQVQEANVLLNRDAQGANNWTLKKDDPDKTPSNWKFDLQKVMLEQVKVQVADAASELALDAELDSLKEASKEGYGIAFKAKGRYNKADISGEGQTGDILSLRDSSKPFPLQGKVSVGQTSIGIEGSLTKPQQLASLDVRLTLAGDSMADLFPLIGVSLPQTPPYSTEGRLIGLLEGDNDKWRYEEFKGVMGESDLEGTVEYLARKPRSLLTGDVQSRLLRFKDLGPLIGADTSDVKGAGAKDDKVKQPPGKALPVAPINTKVWGAMDADVKFRGVKILRIEALPLENIDAHIKLNDSVLSLVPLNFGFAGGTLSNTITLDGRGEKMQAEMVIAARHLKLKKLFPGAETMKASFGELHGDANLKAQGSSIAELLGHSNGQFKALVSRGTVSRFLLEAAGLNVANMVLAKLFGDEQVVLNCVATDFTVTDGLMTAKVFKLETDDTTVDITGTINMRTEVMDLDIRPENRTVRIFTLRSPLYAKGTFKDPEVGVQMGPLAARAGAAVALGVVATPLAALLPLLNVGSNESNDCAPMLGEKAKKNRISVAKDEKGKSIEMAPSGANGKAGSERENWPSNQPNP
ncbi:AsmA family protein [Candidimonas sp. SYP-B2681]|uniref:AsmA family protein n=1 Tax=Candidimonas sp. SYP-B2681 TaxID=2497686 RepID=UPI000F8613E1|nr:AsmA family protein [Candidimonas sp. SYP-B2681]RTZ40034.1 AsmA family protein [Candidimonas sp. SYP-B2681]